MNKEKIILSYSAMKALLECEMKYYYEFVRCLEKKQWKKYFVEGEIFQFGVFQLMAGESIIDARKAMLKKLDDKLKELRKDFSISTQDEQTFVEIKATMTGMLDGYADIYNKDLKLEKHIANELSCVYPISDRVMLGVQMDNIIEAKGKWLLHEGKAWKYLNTEVVNNVKKSFQVATYFHSHNNLKNTLFKTLKGKKEIWVDKFVIPIKKFSGVVFDAVQKPSIKLKQGETYRGYLKRLADYYTGAERNNKFFKEVFNEPEIKFKDWYNTVNGLAKRAEKIADGKGPIKSFSDCGWCDFEPLCLGDGETKQNMVMYRKSKYSERYKGIK